MKRKKQSGIEKRASSVIVYHTHHWVRKRVWIYLSGADLEVSRIN